MRWITIIKVGGSIMSGVVTASSLILNVEGVSQLMGYQVQWQWWASGGFLAFACFMGWIIYGLRQDTAAVGIREEFLKEHLKEIENLIKEWKSGIKTPDIFQVHLDSPDFAFYWENNRLFSSLKEHLLCRDLWRDYDAWKTRSAEYVDKCKKLRWEIRESWKIQEVEITRYFEEPILRLISGQDKKLLYKLYVLESHNLSE